MRSIRPLLLLATLTLTACSTSSGTEPPPEGWANRAPTVVTQVIDRPETQLLQVEQGELAAWIEVPKVGAKVGDYVLLGQGTPRTDVEIPELGQRVGTVVDIAHVRVVDQATAQRTIRSQAPQDAVPVGTVFAELASRVDQPIVVHGTAVKVTSVAGSHWVHLQDGTGSAAAGTNDLMVQSAQPVTVGQRATLRGTLRQDVDIGFGYHFDVMVQDATRVE